MRRGLASGLAAAAALAAAQPASARTAQDEQLWINATVMGGVDGGLVYFAEMQPRFGQGVTELSQLLLRPAIGWKLSDRVSVYQGYARVRTAVAIGPDTTEDRSFQQISWSIGKVAGGALSSRTRIEQRWLSTGDDMGWRLREMIRYSHSLTDAKRGVAALGWVEGFFALNDTDWGARSGFDRVRTFAGLEVPLSGRSTVELGYLNQTVNGRRGATAMDHVASISLFLRP